MLGRGEFAANADVGEPERRVLLLAQLGRAGSGGAEFDRHEFS